MRHATPLPAWRPGTGRNLAAFTLIELLIVVAIIAILAAIAVPNFLEAQTRAKVSRAKADLRTIATGLESYVVDHNHYPPNDLVYNVTPVQLSTPIAYISSSRLPDPFTAKEIIIRFGVPPDEAKYYTYTKVVDAQEYANYGPDYTRLPPEGVDNDTYNLGAQRRYGDWRTCSNGPDRKYSQSFPAVPLSDFNPRPGALLGADIPYDSTNGTVSFGNILRTQLRHALSDAH
ncbi:MAG: prepilin-type N-terminal cleavage/methylation domain-containing protein [Candidatus Sumerlaeaceae bacterium]